MSGDNPFDIKNDNPAPPVVTIKKNATIPKYQPGRKFPKTEYTSEQIKKLLNGYIEVPRTSWGKIPLNSHIRYLKKDGTFARGGFVINHWLNKDGTPFIHLANNFKKNAQGYKTWPMAHENVSKLFKKPGANNGIEMDVVRKKTGEIIGQINKIVDAIKEIKTSVKKNEDDIKKMFIIIQKIAKK
jgi:hypothetical protein